MARRIIVSIDFGTTYSGIAWADSIRPDIQHVISEWPSVDGSVRSSPKVPTELRRVASGWQWGFQIPETAKRSKYFKLKLDDPSSVTKEGASALELTKIYLSCLYQYFIHVLESRLSPNIVRSTLMDFVVSVPAIWSDAAKQATERAAAMAGFRGEKRIQLISEPEAAALYTLTSLNPRAMSVGRKFIVCDAGGGTVDLITYEIMRADRLQVREVTEGTGGRCGSSVLNMRFRRHLKHVHGERYWTDDRLVPVLNEFEGFKKTFSATSEPLTLRVDPSLGLRRDRYTMPQEEMKGKVFGPIMSDVICLIQEQIAMAGGYVSAIILVGGFGQSNYLQGQVREAIHPSIGVFHPQDAWSAVVKGGVIHGLGQHRSNLSPIGVTSRVARRSYGTCLLTKYEMMRHDAKEAFWSDKEQDKVVPEMCWFIQKGQSYPEGEPSTIEYQCDIPVTTGHEPQTEIDIYSSEDRKAPTHPNQSTRKIATLALDLSRIPNSVKRASERKKMGLHEYYCLSGVIQANYGSAEITYSVKLGGVTHDVVTARYDR